MVPQRIDLLVDLEAGDLAALQAEPIGDLDRAAWERSGEADRGGPGGGRPAALQHLCADAVLPRRLRHPLADGREAAAIAPLVVDDGVGAEAREHGARVVLVLRG